MNFSHEFRLHFVGGAPLSCLTRQATLLCLILNNMVRCWIVTRFESRTCRVGICNANPGELVCVNRVLIGPQAAIPLENADCIVAVCRNAARPFESKVQMQLLPNTDKMSSCNQDLILLMTSLDELEIVQLIDFVPMTFSTGKEYRLGRQDAYQPVLIISIFE